VSEWCWLVPVIAWRQMCFHCLLAYSLTCYCCSRNDGRMFSTVDQLGMPYFVVWFIPPLLVAGCIGILFLDYLGRQFLLACRYDGVVPWMHFHTRFMVKSPTCQLTGTPARQLANKPTTDANFRGFPHCLHNPVLLT